jgi:uncharacterized protein YegP (UPF0339 family)
MVSRRTFALAVLGTLATAAGLSAADGKLKFELYKDAKGEFRWRLKGGNGEALATSGQGYKAKADAKNAIERIRKDAGGDKLTFETYEDAKKEHRWRLKAANGQTIASSSEGYKAKADAEAAIKTVKDGAKDAEVSDEGK